MQNNFNIKIKILNEFGKIPNKSHEGDIGYDLYSDGEYVIAPNKVILVHLGISIDPGYTGELMVPLMNYSEETYTVVKHERVAQLVAITTGNITFKEVSDLDESDRSEGGFGSTGKN